MWKLFIPQASWGKGGLSCIGTHRSHNPLQSGSCPKRRERAGPDQHLGASVPQSSLWMEESENKVFKANFTILSSVKSRINKVIKTYKQLKYFHVIFPWEREWGAGEGRRGRKWVREREEIRWLCSKQWPTRAFFSFFSFKKKKHIWSQSLYTSGQKQLDSSALYVIIMKIIYFPWLSHLVTQLCWKLKCNLKCRSLLDSKYC